MTQLSQEASEVMDQCISDCLECSEVCFQSINYCLTKGGRHAEVGHISTLMDCADICEMSARWMNRGSGFSGHLCDICSQVCDECAESCEKLSDDEVMQDCVDVCRRCAESCRNMVNQMQAVLG